MNRRWRFAKLPLLLLLSFSIAPSVLSADVFKIDFEDLTDGTFVSTQYPGVTFSNAIVSTAGISLNEIDFPPRSGVNIVGDAGGPISLVFTTPVLEFLGYFTYIAPVTIQGFDASNSLLSSETSVFSNNTGTGGDPGSNPNELVEISSATGFSTVVITGNPGGGSFALDDISFTNGATSVTPEPSSVILTGFAVLLLAVKAGRRC